MNILHIVSSDKWSGAVEPAVRLCINLRKQGHTADFICPSPNPDLENWLKKFGLEANHSLTLNTRFDPVGMFSDLTGLRKIFRKKRYDILHCHLSNDHLISTL